MSETAQATAEVAGDSTATEGQTPDSVIAHGEALDQPATETENNETEITKQAKAEDEVEVPELTEAQINAIIRKAKYKAKVDGEELELDYDTLMKDFGTTKAATKRFQEASELAKTAKQKEDALAQFLNSAKENPRTIFELAQRLGHDPKQLAKDLVWEEIQYEKLSPVERELLETKKRLEAYEREKTEAEEARKVQEQQQLAKQYEQEIETDVQDVLKVGKFKPSKEIVARIAEVYQHWFRAHGKKATTEQVVTKVRQWIDQDLASELTVESDDQVGALIGRLPKTTLQALKKHFIKEAQATKAAKMTASMNGTTEPSAPKKTKKIGINDYFKNL